MASCFKLFNYIAFTTILFTVTSAWSLSGTLKAATKACLLPLAVATCISSADLAHANIAPLADVGIGRQQRVVHPAELSYLSYTKTFLV
jgi:hypothetical protein